MAKETEKKETGKNQTENFDAKFLEKIEKIAETSRENVVNNLKYIMEREKIPSQRNLAESLGITPSQLVRILQKQQLPSLYPFLISMRERFHYSIDELLFTNLKETETSRNGVEEDIPAASYMKFHGLYQMYYFDVSAFKGRERSDDAKALKSGVMYVEKDVKTDVKTDRYTVMAILNMSKEAADRFYREALERGQGRSSSNIPQYLKSMGSSRHLYYGELDLSNKYMYLSLRFERIKDQIHMIFYRPDSNSNKYIGGLGVMVSVSKGRNSAPCVQHIALTDVSLNVSEEELAEHLLMHYPNLKTYDSIDDLVDFTTEMYGGDRDGNDKLSRLSDENKKTLIRNRMDQIVNETVEKNLFRSVMVSAIDDDEFYHYIKRVKAYMRAEVR